MDLRTRCRSPAGAKDFPLASASRPALGPTQSHVTYVMSTGGPLPRGKARPLPTSASMVCSGTTLLAMQEVC
jgi:hypothetical protein